MGVADLLLFVHGARSPGSVPLPFGAARFGPYPPKGSGLGPARMDDWIPRDTEVTLPPGLTLTGRVLENDDPPRDDFEGQIWRWTRTGGWAAVTFYEDGVLLERGLPAGPVALVWIPSDHSPFEEPECDPDRLDLPVSWYQAGEKDIVFTVPSR